jgi:DNA replication and repair protein RecF
VISSLELTNFRSYEEARFDLSPSVTVVVGPNASGKTNLLEALFVLASTKSFRAKDHELIKHGADYFRVVAHEPETEIALGVGNQDGRQVKQVSYNGSKKTLVGHVGRIQVTLFEPSDLELVSGSPERRRRYLDYILCQTDRTYLKVLSQYRRVLRQRNSLLSTFDMTRIKDEIFTWDLKLAELAAEIYHSRLQLLAYLDERASGLYADVAGEAAPLMFEYQPTIKAGSDYASAFLAELTRRLTTDLSTGFTTIGPHREDFRIRFKNNDISAVASRGETRTIVLVLKLAELQYSYEQTDTKPILLLDDVFSELDNNRRRYLMDQISDHQTLITTTDADTIEGLGLDYQTINTGATRAV